MQPAVTSIPSVAKQGVKVVGINAGQPMGSGLVTIANFTGAADTNIATAAASLPLSEWYSRTDSGTNGTSILLLRPGQYEVAMNIAMSTAARVQAGILRGSAAPPANPIFSNARILAAFDHLGAAAGSFHTVTITRVVDVADGDIDGNNNMIRFSYSNAAGAAPGAAIGSVLAENGYAITRGTHVQSLA